MNWRNVRLIFAREIRDQLRDRRTLFMIVVLPLLLYPLVGMSLFQVINFMQEHAAKVLVIGGEQLSTDPPLIVKGEFNSKLFASLKAEKLIDMDSFSHLAPEAPAESPADRLQRQILGGEAELDLGDYEVAVYFPPDFAEKMAAGEDPSPLVFHNTSQKKSQTANRRMMSVLIRWKQLLVEEKLLANNLPVTTTRPFVIEQRDVASEEHRGSAVWSILLPIVLIIWALTGAFYPAVDLCAGEKERGTLETLLSSPALRSEIVLGKLATVMLFSIVTAALNLGSLATTGALFATRMPEVASQLNLGPLPLSAMAWMLLALLPLSALFSALCLALAALARSTKEGQYYLMPLLFLTMPLAMWPMAPGVELTLGTSLIPVTGVMLVLRELLQGNYADALWYTAPTLLVTLTCMALAIRWAVAQFHSETVLFGEAERLDLMLRLKRMVTHRRPTPTVAAAFMCAVLILIVRFFMGLMMPRPTDFGEFFLLQALTLVAFVAGPALLMTALLTRSARRTLLLRRTRWEAIPIAALLAVALHPVAIALHRVVAEIYPMPGGLDQLGELTKLFAEAEMWQVLLLLAVLPAICEELAFRGFILSGLRHLGSKWGAIVISSIFFGITHLMLQQSVMAAIIGVVIGYMAVQTGSLLPCMVYHVVHNGLMFIVMQLAKDGDLTWLLGEGNVKDLDYPLWFTAIGVVIAIAIMRWLHGLPVELSPEESRQAAIDKSAHAPLG
jgi:sodium transport system permease protein